MVAFRLPSSTDWKLGIVKSIFPLNNPPVVDLFEWTGRVSSPGFSDFVSLKDVPEWSDISFCFTLQELSPDGMELVLVDQIRGIPIGNNPISDNTGNCRERGIQCSSNGPDIFSPQISTIFGNKERKHFNFNSLSIEVGNVPFCSTYVLNNKNKRCRSQIAASIRIHAPKCIHLWNKRCNVTVRNNILGSFLIVTKKDQTPASKTDISVTPMELKGKFIVPDMQSFEDHDSFFQYFSLLSNVARGKLEKCRDGVSPSEYDDYFQSYLSCRNPLFSCPHQRLILHLQMEITLPVYVKSLQEEDHPHQMKPTTNFTCQIHSS